MTPKQHSPQPMRSNRHQPVAGTIILLLVILVGISILYGAIPPATTTAEYTITLGEPFRDDGFEQVTAFEQLSPAEQAVFVDVYRAIEFDDRREIHTEVQWNDRRSSPYHQFHTIHYVLYRGRYYPVTTTVEKDHTSYTVIRYVVLGIGAIAAVSLLALLRIGLRSYANSPR